MGCIRDVTRINPVHLPLPEYLRLYKLQKNIPKFERVALNKSMDIPIKFFPQRSVLKNTIYLLLYH